MSFEVAKKHAKAHGQSIWSVACRNKHVVTGGVDGKVKLWQQDDPFDLKNEFAASSLSVVSVACSQTYAYSSSMDSHIKVWDLESGQQVADIDCGPIETWSICVNPTNPDLVATTGHSGNVKIWNVKTSTSPVTIDTASGKFIMSVAWSPDGKLIACGGMDGMIYVFTETGTKKYTIEAHTGCVRSLSFASDSKTLVSGSDDTFVHVYDTSNGQLLRSMSGHQSWVLSVAVSPNSKFIATSSNDKTVKVWEFTTGECVSSLNKEHSEAVWSVCWNNTGSRLFAVGDDGQLVAYNCLDK